MNLRPATAADIAAMMELERVCPTAAHWTEEQYLRAVRPDSDDPERRVLVAEQSQAPAGDGGIKSSPPLLGFLVARHLAPEWELENIVVAPDARRQGIGGRLLNALLAQAKETDSESVSLEVRESNVAARRLYEGAGFQQVGRRKSYYAGPPEDAISYRRAQE